MIEKYSKNEEGIYELSEFGGFTADDDIKLVFYADINNEQWFNVPSISDAIILHDYLCGIV